MKKGLRIGAGVVVVAILALALSWHYFFPDWAPRPNALTNTLDWREIEFGGHARTFKVYAPHTRAEHPALIVALHGARSKGQRIRDGFAYGLDLVAEREGAIILYPDGYEKRWNDCRAGITRLDTRKAGIDDVAFLNHLVDLMVEEYGIDRTRIYGTGLGDGGFMLFRMVRESGGLFRAIAPIGATEPVSENDICKGGWHALDLFLIAGSEDPFLPAEGKDQKFWWVDYGPLHTADVTARLWADRAGYKNISPWTGQLADTRFDDGSTVETMQWMAPGKPMIRYYKVIGGGHSVPNPAMIYPRYLGPTNADFSSAEAIWAFFKTVEQRSSR